MSVQKMEENSMGHPIRMEVRAEEIIEAVKKIFPTKKVGVAIPIGRRAEELKLVTDFHRKVKRKHLQTCQFDDTIPIAGAVLQRPASWK